MKASITSRKGFASRTQTANNEPRVYGELSSNSVASSVDCDGFTLDEYIVAQIIDVKAIAAEVRADVRPDVDAWTARGHRPPFLSAALLGEDPAPASYERGNAPA